MIFPVALDGAPRYTNDFGAPRSGGRTHEGIDIFAPMSTPILMPKDGVVAFFTDGIGGPSFGAKFDDATRAYATHLSAYAFGLPLDANTKAAPRRALAGQTIGFVGRGGNAIATPTHLHFQMWDAQGVLVNPFPFLQAAEQRYSRRVEPPPPPPASQVASSGVVGALAGGAVIVVLASAFAYAMRV